MSDELATSRAIDALNDPKWQAFAEALVDRVAAIVGLYQVKNEDERAEQRKLLTQIGENQVAFSHPLGALVAKQDLITEHLARQDRTLEAVSTGQSVLRAEFQASAEHLDGRLNMIDERLTDLDTWKRTVETTLADFHQSRQRSIEDRQALQTRQDETNADLAGLQKGQTEMAASLVEIQEQLSSIVASLAGRDEIARELFYGTGEEAAREFIRRFQAIERKVKDLPDGT